MKKKLTMIIALLMVAVLMPFSAFATDDAASGTASDPASGSADPAVTEETVTTEKRYVVFLSITRLRL